MEHTFAVSKTGRSLLIGLIFVLVLTACAGNQNENSLQSASRGGALSAQSELPKAANPAAAPAQPQPASIAQAAKSLPDASGAANQAAAPVPQEGGAAQAPAGALPAAPAVAKAEVVVDTNLPVEPKVGSRAPEFTMQTLDGKTVNLSDLLGSPVVISYWATWCIPCKQELPILERLYKEYSARGLVVVTVNALDQDDLAKVQTMAGDLGMSYPVLLDQNKVFSSAYQAMFFPSTYFINPNGVIQAIKLGDSTEADLRAKIESLLAGQ